MQMETEGGTGNAVDGATVKITPTQEKYLSLFQKSGSIRAVAQHCGVNWSTVGEALSAVAKKKGLSGWRDLQVDCISSSKTSTVDVKTTNRSGAKKSKVSKSKVSALVAMVESQQHRCALSGIKIEPDNANLDHKTPLSRGGTDELENLQWLDKEVNRAKGAMTNEEFISLCRRVVAWNA